MTILQQSTISLVPAASIVKSNFDHFYAAPSSKDEEPRLTDEFYEDGRTAVKRRQAFSAEHQAAFEQYQLDRQAWEERMSKAGGKYSAESVGELKEKAFEALIDYLKATSAPDEILAIAWGYRELTWSYFNYGRRWHALPQFARVTVGKYMPLVRKSIKVIRDCLNASKAK